MIDDDALMLSDGSAIYFRCRVCGGLHQMETMEDTSESRCNIKKGAVFDERRGFRLDGEGPRREVVGVIREARTIGVDIYVAWRRPGRYGYALSICMMSTWHRLMCHTSRTL